MTQTAPEIGKAAPAFRLPASDGTELALKDMKGRKVVLFFYPQDETPTCTQEACEFRDAYAVFAEEDTVVIGISPDSVASHEKFIRNQQLNYILLADEQLKVCKKYDVWKMKKLYGREYMGVVRSTFLIDRKGRLAAEWRNIRIKGHVDKVLEAARKLK
ncbi:peroxiredoxin [Paenibacillus koleovorans]|uniref:peroxiredoxin n=1 Tax=Paenibacillus koleovorans TaxID=121608 RepID=UPI000FD7418F|nr:peroxiredoxin [Paenibacillus koleovorans]